MYFRAYTVGKNNCLPFDCGCAFPCYVFVG